MQEMWAELINDMEDAVATIFNQCYYDNEEAYTDKLHEVMFLYPTQPPDWQKGVDDTLMALIGNTAAEFMERVIEYAGIETLDYGSV